MNHFHFSWAHYYSAGKAVISGSISEVLSYQFWNIYRHSVIKRSLEFMGRWLVTGKNGKWKVWGKRLQSVFEIALKEKKNMYLLASWKNRSKISSVTILLHTRWLFLQNPLQRNVNMGLNKTPCSEMYSDVKAENSLNTEETPLCRTELECYNACSAATGTSAKIATCLKKF